LLQFKKETSVCGRALPWDWESSESIGRHPAVITLPCHTACKKTELAVDYI